MAEAATQTAAKISPIDMGTPRRTRSLWHDSLRRLLRNKAAVAGGIFVILLFVVAVFADDWFIAWALDREPEAFLAPYGWKEVDFQNTRSSPSLQRTESGGAPHLMGTDKYGRDVFSRIIFGARVSLAVGVFGSFVIMVFGLTYGSISGYLGGAADTLMMRFVDIMYAFPTLLLIILF